MAKMTFLGCTALLLTIALPYVVPQNLLALHQTSNIQIWESSTSMLASPLSIHTANLPGDDSWKSAGMRAQANANEHLAEPIWIFKEVDPSNEDLMPAFDFQFMWSTYGGLMDNHMTIWKPNCFPGYNAVSELACDGAQENPQVCDELWSETVCVRISMTELCEIGDFIGNDQGSVSSTRISFWGINATDTSVSGYYATSDRPEDPPVYRPWCIRKDAFIDITY